MSLESTQGHKRIDGISPSKAIQEDYFSLFKEEAIHVETEYQLGNNAEIAIEEEPESMNKKNFNSKFN